MRMVFCLLMVFSTPPCASMAQDRFDRAVERWLATEDADALPLLAELAAAGDERAMLLLGVLDREPTRSDWFAALDRKQKIALMRAPGGLSGKSWLTKVTDQRALADALTYTTATDDFAARATALFAMGETAAGRRIALTAYNINPSVLAEIDATTPLPDNMNHLLWWSAQFATNPDFWLEDGTRPPTPHEADLVAEAASPEWQGSFQQRLYLSMLYPDAGAAGMPQMEFLTDTVLRQGESQADTNPKFGAPLVAGGSPSPERSEAYDAAAEILMQAKELAPIRNLCEAACADGVSDCLRTVYGQVQGAGTLVFMGPPLSTMIPQDHYFASPRFLHDLRLLASPPDDTNAYQAAYAACGMTLLHPAP
jgi:hypothetical protein